VIEFTGARTVEYDAAELMNIELAYATTVHKAMGSEFDVVIMPVLSAHSILLNRSLLYTAVTRAKRRVYLVGQRKALFLAIHKSKTDKRNTMLGERILRSRRHN
jgi:exodeoxyribonuclease V alpha subunit